MAIISAAYAIYHGPRGIKEIAERISKLAKSFADKIKKSGYELYSDNFFDTVTILTKNKTQNIYKNALRNGVNLRLVDDSMLSVAFEIGRASCRERV